jgi:hypothetical protein
MRNLFAATTVSKYPVLKGLKVDGEVQPASNDPKRDF